MAGIAIPLISTFGPGVIGIIAKLVDKLLGDHTGDKKKQVATNIVKTLGQGLVDTGQATADKLPNDTQIQQMIQDAVDRLNKDGQLLGTHTIIPVSEPSKNDLTGVVRVLLKSAVDIIDQSK